MAFNKCCEGIKPNADPDDYVPENPLQCVDIHNECYCPSPEVSFNTNIRPDLCLSFDSKADSWLPCDHPNVVIEVNESALTDLSSGTRGEPSLARNELMVHLFDCVAYGQWLALPYRFCWSISISGHLMRIWRWSATGAVVTEPIEYLEDAAIVAQFIQLVASGPYSRLGLDVGRGMTFSSMASTVETQRTRRALTVYTNALPHDEARTRWLERAEKCKVWRFTSTCSEGPSASPHPYHQLDDKRYVDDYILVASHPISWNPGMFSRGTRCYIGIYQSDAKQEAVPIEDIHTLKFSWQYTTRTPE
jgi:Fungal protein kinase